MFWQISYIWENDNLSPNLRLEATALFIMLSVCIHKKIRCVQKKIKTSLGHVKSWLLHDYNMIITLEIFKILLNKCLIVRSGQAVLEECWYVLRRNSTGTFHCVHNSACVCSLHISSNSRNSLLHWRLLLHLLWKINSFNGKLLKSLKYP